MNSFHKFLIILILSISSYSYAGEYADEEIVLSYAKDSAYSLMAKRILTLAYSRIDKNIKFEKIPARRSLIYAENGFSDGLLARSADVKEEYSHLIMIPTPIAYDVISVYSKKINFKVDGWNSLLPYSIGYVAGSKTIERKTKGMNVETVTTATQGLNKINFGRNDVFIGLTGVQCVINILDLSEINVNVPPLETIILYHYLHKKYKAMADKLEVVLRQMKESGEMALIQKQSYQDFLSQCK